MKKYIIIGVLILVGCFIVYSIVFKPSKEDLEIATQGYLKEEYKKAEALYKEDSIYYSSFANIKTYTEALFNKVEYKTPVDIVCKERKDLVNEMANPEEVARRLTWAMKNRGGILTLKIYANTYNGANTGNYRVVIVDNDNREVYREDLESSKADVWDASGFGNKYWNLANVRLKDKVTFPFKVYLINLLDSSRSEFTITTTE